MTHKARCGNYENRPQFCRDYPRITDAMPASCTYRFHGDQREGTCQPEVCQENACCNWPRRGGEPAAEALDRESGGKPCKHLEWEDVPENKTASGEIEYDPCEVHETLFCQMARRGS